VKEGPERALARERMTVSTLWRVLVTLICIGAIMALPQGSTTVGNLAGSGSSALEAWMRAGDQPPSFTLYPEGRDRGVAAVLVH
jgi:hypothetical protein